MEDSNQLALENVINLTKSSEKKFKQGNFKEAITDKRQAKLIIKSRFDGQEIIEKFKKELSKIYSSKFDLINDHKLKISKFKINEIVKLLEQKSEEKFQKGDYKGAIKALRRSDKYLSK